MDLGIVHFSPSVWKKVAGGSPLEEKRDVDGLWVTLVWPPIVSNTTSSPSVLTHGHW